MSISFPRTDIMGFCGWRGCEFEPATRKEFSREAGGRTTDKLMGPTLWRCQFVSVPLTNRRAGELRTRLASIEERSGTFRAHDVRRPRPAASASGALNSASIFAIGSDMRSLRIGGLPAGLVLTEGDYLSFPYAGQRALHRVAETVTTAITGITPMFEVIPHLRTGVTTGSTVTLVNAYAHFRLESVSVSMVDQMHETVSFSGFQVP